MHSKYYVSKPQDLNEDNENNENNVNQDNN